MTGRRRHPSLEPRAAKGSRGSPIWSAFRALHQRSHGSCFSRSNPREAVASKAGAERKRETVRRWADEAVMGRFGFGSTTDPSGPAASTGFRVLRRPLLALPCLPPALRLARQQSTRPFHYSSRHRAHAARGNKPVAPRSYLINALLGRPNRLLRSPPQSLMTLALPSTPPPLPPVISPTLLPASLVTG